MPLKKKFGLHEYTTVVSFKCPEGLRLAIERLALSWGGITNSDVIRLALEDLMRKKSIDPYKEQP